MVEAKLLRKKLKNGLIVDKWDLVTIIEKQQADKDRALRILKEVDGVLLDYIEQLEKKPMTTLAHGRGVALAVKYMIAVLEEAQEK